MPFTYVIDKARRLVVSTGLGCVTFEEIREHQRRLTSDPDFDPQFDQLIDMTGTSRLDLTVDQVKIAASQKIFSSTSRRALVATDPAIFGVGRMLETYYTMASGNERARVLYDKSEALKWLGVKGELNG